MYEDRVPLVRILMVEDNPADAEILTEVLAADDRSPFRIQWVERLADAIERLSNTQFDVVLLDLKLPDSDGLESIDRIHATSETVPVVVMTGFDDDALAAEAKRRGARGYLVKGRTSIDYIKQVLTAAAVEPTSRPTAVNA